MKAINSNKEYQTYVDKQSPNSPILKNCFNAFFIGGLICTIGQIIFDYCLFRKIPENLAGSIVSISLIFISSSLTALNLFNRIGKFAGARKSCSYNWFCQLNNFSCYGIQV